jgi:hypothetical protein
MPILLAVIAVNSELSLLALARGPLVRHWFLVAALALWGLAIAQPPSPACLVQLPYHCDPPPNA